jgi:hypothetical protein
MEALAAAEDHFSQAFMPNKAGDLLHAGTQTDTESVIWWSKGKLYLGSVNLK